MTAIRVALWTVGTLSAAYAVAALWLLPWLDFGLAVAICSSCVIGLGLVRAIQKDRERARQYREQVWQRRIENDPWIADFKPWPVGDDEMRP